MASVVEVWRYPVKSMAGERLESCAVTETGLEGDRRWAIVDGSPNRAGKLLTISKYAPLMAYQARLAGGVAEVLTPAGEKRRLDGELVAEIAVEASRPLTMRELDGANFDDSPVLVVNLATVAALGVDAGQRLDHRRFRANLYVDGPAPEEEIEWLGRRLRVGDAELEVVSRCVRCVVITHDPDTMETSPELLRLLTETRQTCLGMYCRVTKSGHVAVGNELRVV